MKTGQVSAVLPLLMGVVAAHADDEEQRQLQVVDDVARAQSPASNRPVHWIITTGRLPPRSRPAATAMASPSRQTRISVQARLGDGRAGSQVPRSLSGIQTTWVTPHFFSAADRRRAVEHGGILSPLIYFSSSQVPQRSRLLREWDGRPTIKESDFLRRCRLP